MKNFAKAMPMSLLAAIAVVWMVLAGSPAHAVSSVGYTGRTSLSGGVGCFSCHGSAADPGTSVVINGPASLLPGASATYTITATRAASGSGKRVGIDVAASDANTLSTVAGEPTTLTNMEIVHTTSSFPLKTTSAAGSASYSFKYTMPANAAIGSSHTIAGVSAVSYTGGSPSTWNLAPDFTVTTAAPPPGSAGTYYVSATTGNDNNNGSQAAPYKTIKTAMGASAAGAIINVAAGTYNPALGETFPIAMKSGVQLISTSGAASTIIDAGGTSQRVFNCDGNAATTLIQGFTITHGSIVAASPGSPATGGAILCTNNDQTVISNNILTVNYATGADATTSGGTGGPANGGAVYISGSSTTLVNNVISNNTATGGAGYTIPFNKSGATGVGGAGYGGGIYVASGTPLIINNTFYGNIAQGGNGGVNINNTSVGSNGGIASGGAAFLASSSLVNNIFSNNSAVGGSGSGSNGVTGNASEGAINGGTVDHNLFFGNTAANANPDGNTGTNAIVGQNPQFTSPSDYHISGVSPAKGAGAANNAPGTDFDGHVRGNPPALGAFDPVVPALTLNIVPGSVAEGATATGTVTRNTSTVNPLAVNILSSDPSAATAQPSLIIPAGAAFATFAVSAVADGVADGTQMTTVTVSATGFTSANAPVTVTDIDIPTLTLSLATAPATNPVTFSESAGATAATGTVIRNTPLNVPLTVNLSSSDPSRATVPTTVTIPAGSNAANFAITAVNNAVADGSPTLTFTASQSGFTSGTATAVVTDDDAPALTVSINPNSFSEGAGANAATGTVTRNTATTSALTVNLSSSNTGEATVPVTVTIPVGATSATFAVAAVDDALVDGDQTVTITASVTGFTSGTATVTVTNNDGASLSLSIAPNSFSEGAGANAATGTVTRNTATTLALTVNLSSNNTAKATVPATVDIPAGATSVTFPINAVDNAVADGPQTVVIAASAAGFGTGSATATVTDNDTPTLGLSLSPTIFSEAAGAKATMGTVTRNTPTTSALVVTLSSGNTTKGTVPATVTIPVGATSATFPIAAVDNAIADGPQSVVFTASAPGFTPGTASATVLDNEVAQLSLTVTPGTFSEGAGSHAATGTITRNTPLTSPLVVHLSSSDTTEATVPATVTIPTGQASASFLVAAVNDTLVDGSQVVALNATATGFVPGTTSLTVTDNEPNTLNLSVTPTSFSETAGNSASFGTVTRTGAKTAPLVVTLASNNASAKVPPTITIPAGATFAIFPIGAVDNTTAEGTRNAIISATAPGLPTAKAGVTITDNELPALTLSVSPTTFSEGAGAGVVHGTVTRNTPPTASLVVTLKSSDTTSATVPASITIPAGATAVTFNITPVNNAVVNGPRTVTFMASATGHAPATTSATVTDDEGPTLSVKVNPAVFSEAGGAVASKGTVTRTGSTATALTVALASDNIKKVKVPVSVTIPAGAASATFNIGAVNNTLVDGPQAVTITASASGYNTGAAAVTVNDDDGKLTLTVTPNTFSEGAGAKAAVGTVTRNTPATDSLTVSLKSSDVTEAKVPATVIIPAGSTSVTFPIAAVDDTLVDGSQSVTLTASTAGLTVGTAKITVTDNDHATPPAHAVIAPSTVALSTSAARVTTDSVQLKFTAALDAESASDPAHYGVKVNGQAITVESAAYNATNHSVILSLPEGTLQSGNRVVVEWLDVADSSGKLMTGQTGVLSAQ